MHIIESNSDSDSSSTSSYVNYIGYIFYLYCFFAFISELNPDLNLNHRLTRLLKEVIKFIEKNIKHYNYDLENITHLFFTGKFLYKDELLELLEREKEEQERKDQEEQERKEQEDHEKKEKPVLYEDKYLDKFKNFPNTFFLTECELEQEKTIHSNLKTTYETKLTKDIDGFQKKIATLETIIELYQSDTTPVPNVEQMLQYFGIVEEYAEDPDDFDLDELFNDIKNEYNLSKTALNELTTQEMPDFLKQAKDAIVNQKLDGYKNNYILETTPLGNVYMRYNNYKQSFEYFSNSTIPYRYLEAIGRKYVMTYWCKPLFIDLAEELKKAKEKQEAGNSDVPQDLNTNTNTNKQKPSSNTSGASGVMNKIKKYNTNSGISSTSSSSSNSRMPSKNRVQNEFVLPPQIKANLPNVNSSGENQVFKECANRYTWEGRIANLTLLKNVDKKLVNKNQTMSFADFKLLRK